jgi:hypothetical protein
MQNKVQYELPEKDIVQIKEINEDEYWAKEFGFDLAELNKTDSNLSIYDKIINAYIKNNEVKH